MWANPLALLTLGAFSAGQVAAQAWGGCSRCSDGLNGGALLSFTGQNSPVAGNSLVAGGGRNAIKTGKMDVMAVKNGDLVLHDFDGKVAWSTKTGGRPEGANYLIMQPDGNLVYYDFNKKAIWASNTMKKGTGPYCALLQRDRNFVLYDAKCTPQWASNSRISDRPADSNGNCKTYTVQTGDWCTKIAEDNGIEESVLGKYNPTMKCNALQPGQRLCVTLGKKVSLAPKPNGDNCFAYAVKKDESCNSIATKYDLTVDDIENFNKKTFHWIGCANLQLDANICLSTGNPPKPKTIKGLQCGPQSESGSECPLKACCSAWGYCGTTKEFCGKTAQGFPCNSNCQMPTIPKTDGSAFKMKVGYYLAGGADRKCDAVKPHELDLETYTHLNFAFATLNPMGTGLRFSQREYDILHSVADLKRKFPKLKVILAIGGWDFSESDATKHIFTLAFATKQSRTYLIDSIVQQMQNLNLDGVDLDYEYPSAMERQAPPSDTKDFALFLDELRARVGDRKLITVAVPAGFWFLKGFDVDNIVKNCDFINVMNYDYNGPWNAGPAGKWDQTAYYKTAPHTGMKQIRESTELLIRAKVPLSKVNIGLGFYGRSYKLTDPNCQGYGCAMTGGGTAQQCSGQAGVWSNMEISRVIEGGIVTGRYDPDSQTKWFNYQGDQITYDDRETIAQKVAFAKSAGFGGSMVWSLDLTHGNGKGDPDSVLNKDEDDSMEVIEEFTNDEFLAQVASHEGMDVDDLPSIKPLLDNNHAEMNKKYDAWKFIGDTPFWKEQDGSKEIPDALDKIFDAVTSDWGDLLIWPHQRMQLSWHYLEDTFRAMTKTWENTPDKEAYEGEVRTHLYKEKQNEFYDWLSDNYQKYFKCSLEWKVEHGGDDSNWKCMGSVFYGGRPTTLPAATITWHWLPKDGIEEQFLKDVEEAVGLSSEYITFEGSGRYTPPTGPGHAARIGKNMPEVSSQEYPVKFLPLIEDFLKQGLPKYADASRAIADRERLDYEGADVKSIRDNVDAFMINVSSWYNVFSSWWVAKNLDAKIEAALEEQRRQARIQLILSLVFLVVGELIAPILQGAMAAASRIASAALKGLGRNKELVKLIDDAATGSIAARQRLMASKSWKESSVVKTFDKIKGKFKGVNDDMVCLIGEVAWEVGSGYIPTPARRRAFDDTLGTLVARHARDGRGPLPQLQELVVRDPSAIVQSEYESVVDVAEATYVSLDSRARRKPPTVEKLLELFDEQKATEAFASFGGRDGKSFTQNCKDKFNNNKNLKPYVVSEALKDADKSKDYPYWFKHGQDLNKKDPLIGWGLNADHMVEKKFVAQRFVTPLAQFVRDNSQFKKDITDALASYEGTDDKGNKVKLNFAHELCEAVNGQRNMYFLDGSSNGGKENLVSVSEGSKQMSGAGAKYGHNIGSNAIKTYIDDNIDTMEANAKNIQKIQTEALAHLRKTVKDLDKSAGFTALENKAKTDAAKLVDIYKKGGLLQGNAATFQNNMRNVQPNNLARVFFEEGSNTMSNKSWDAKDLDAGVAPGTSKAARDAAKKRKADRAAQAAQNVSGASTNNVQGGPTTAKAQQCLKKK